MLDATHPPAVLEGARVIEYALVDETIQFTGRLRLYVGDERLGAVPRLAICEQLADHVLLLMHCDEDWNVLGVQAWNGPASPEIVSIEYIKQCAEGFYSGISAHWKRTGSARQ